MVNTTLRSAAITPAHLKASRERLGRSRIDATGQQRHLWRFAGFPYS
jgi:hypothetical protein